MQYSTNSIVHLFRMCMMVMVMTVMMSNPPCPPRTVRVSNGYTLHIYQVRPGRITASMQRPPAHTQAADICGCMYVYFPH